MKGLVKLNITYFLFYTFLLFSCIPTESEPVVTTAAITNITGTTAECGGNVTQDRGVMVTERRVCWNTYVNPIMSGNKTSDGAGKGSFSSRLTGLLPATTYPVRAYATNSYGTAYGNDVSFTTGQ